MNQTAGCRIIARQGLVVFRRSYTESKIIAFLIAAEKYSKYDISEIKAAIKNKSQWLEEHFPDDYEREVGNNPLFQNSV